MDNEKEDKLKINNIGLGESITKIASQFLERIYHYDKRKENKIAVGDTPPPAKYAEWQDLWIDTSASLDMWNVQFIQSEHQTIYCIDFFGNRHSEDFQLRDGTPYTVEVIADEGYNPGKPNIESGIIHSDIILYAETEAIPIQYTIYIIQSEHQLIKVLVNGIYYTTDTSFIFGTSWSATIIPDPGYTAGQLNMSSGVLTEDITISATEAVINYYWIHISKYTHQRISVYVGDTIYIDDIKLPYGTEWSAMIEADEGYTAGQLNMSSGVLTQDITISATEEILKQYTIHIAQYEHQHIIVTANGNTYRNDIILPYGTKWSAIVESDEGYTAGTINIDSGILTEDVWLTAEEATINTYTITFPSFNNQEIIVTINGVDYKNSPIYVEYGTSWTARVEVTDDRYTPGQVNIPSGVITENVQLNASIAQPIMHTIYITDYDHQTIYVTADGNEYSSKQIPSVQLIHKTEYTVRIEADENYIAGELSTTGGILTEDVTITATEAEANTFDVIIIQTANQTIAVIDDLGTRHTKSFEINRRAPIEIQIVADNGYLAGKPTIDSVVFEGDSYYVTKDITVSAEAATKDNRIHFFIENRPDQTITVTYKGTIYTNGNDFFANPGDTFDTKVTALILGFTAGDCEFAPTYTVPTEPSVIWITAEAPYQKEYVNVYIDDPIPDLYADYTIRVAEPGYSATSSGHYYNVTKANGNPFVVKRGSTIGLSNSSVTLKDGRKSVHIGLFIVSGSIIACEDTHIQFRNPILYRDGICELSNYNYINYPSLNSDITTLTYSIIKNYQLEGDTSGTKSQRSFSGAEAFDIDKLEGAILEEHTLVNPDMWAYGNLPHDFVSNTQTLTSSKSNAIHTRYAADTSTNRYIEYGNARVNMKEVTITVDNNDPNQWIGLAFSTECKVTDETTSYKDYKNQFKTSLTVDIGSVIIGIVFPNDGYRAGDLQGKYVYGFNIHCIENMTVSATPATPVGADGDRNYNGLISINSTASKTSGTARFTYIEPAISGTDVTIYDSRDDSYHRDYRYLYGRNAPTSIDVNIDGFELYTDTDINYTDSTRFNGNVDYDEFTNVFDTYTFKQTNYPSTGEPSCDTATVRFQSDEDGGTGFIFCCLNSGYHSGSYQGYYLQQLFYTKENQYSTIGYNIMKGQAYKAFTYPKQNVITLGTCDQPEGTMPDGGLTLSVTGSVVNQYNTLFYGDVYDTLGDKVIVQYKTPDSSTWTDVDRNEWKIDLPIRTKFRIHKNTSETINSHIFLNYIWYERFDTEYSIGPKINTTTSYNHEDSNLGNVMLRCEKYNVPHKVTIDIYDSKNPEFSISSSSNNGASSPTSSFIKQTITGPSQENRSTYDNMYNDTPYVYYRFNNSNSVNSSRYALNIGTSNIYIAPMQDNPTVTAYVYDKYTYSIVDSSNADTPDFTINTEFEDTSYNFGYAKDANIYPENIGDISIDNPVYRDISNGSEVQYPIKAIMFSYTNKELTVELQKTGTLTDISEFAPTIAFRCYDTSLYYMTGRYLENDIFTTYLVANSIEDKGSYYVLHFKDKQTEYLINSIKLARDRTSSSSVFTYDYKFMRSDISHRSLTFGTYQDIEYRYAGYWAADSLKGPTKTTTGSLSNDIIHGYSSNEKVDYKIKALVFRKSKANGNTSVIIEVQNMTDPTMRYVDSSIGINYWYVSEAMCKFLYRIYGNSISEMIPEFDRVNGTAAFIQDDFGTRYTDFEPNFVSGQNQWCIKSVNTYISKYMIDLMFTTPTGNSYYSPNYDVLRSIYITM